MMSFFIKTIDFLKGLVISLFISEKKMTDPIDFVVTWVNGNDEIWQKEKAKYEKDYNIYKKGNGEERYRDWGLFKYWFRSVEQYAPWVRKVYLVTCGQVPDWLNTLHPKLVLVNHRDYMNEEYLPTFSSPSIEFQFHKINGLSEHFVYFNDDTLLTRNVKPEDFFQEGKPVICAAAFPVRNNARNDIFNHTLFSVLGLVNSLNWKISIHKNPEKWFNYKYGRLLRYNISCYINSYISGIYFTHLPQAFRKSTIEKAWDRFGKELDSTCSHKFRQPIDVMHQIFTIYEIFEGDFIPCSYNHLGRFYFSLGYYYDQIANDIKQHKYKIVCINDSLDITKDNFEIVRGTLDSAFNSILQKKSSYEK